LHLYLPEAGKQNTTYTEHTKQKQKNSALANKGNYTLIWYAFYDPWPQNRTGSILTALEPTRVTCQIALYNTVLSMA